MGNRDICLSKNLRTLSIFALILVVCLYTISGFAFAQPNITITFPPNETIADNTPDLNLSTNVSANITYSWNGEGNISGCRNCDSYNTTYGENNGSDTNLTALWHLNENTGSVTYDETDNNNNGDITSASWTTSGYYGNALEFDGVNDYVNVSYDSSLDILNGNNNYTFVLWFKLNELPSVDVRQNNIFSQRGGTGGGGRTWLNARYTDNHLSTKISGDVFASTGALVIDKWYFVAMRYNGSRTAMFLDGVENTSISDTDSNSSANGEYVMGSYMTGASNFFNGTIDEIAIYNWTLSAGEISQLYTKSFPDGQHNVTAYATESGGNMSSFTKVDFTIDTTPPTVENGNTSDIIYYEDEIVTVDAYDLYGIDAVIVRLDSTTDYEMSLVSGNKYSVTIPGTELTAGTHSIRYYVNDTAGNMNSSVTDSFDMGLITYWPMDENSGSIIYDTNPYHNDGDLSYITNLSCEDSDGPDWTTGKLGYAVKFDGCNDYVNISANSSLNIRDNDSSHTVLAWFKVTQTGLNHTIISQANGNGTGRSWIAIQGSQGSNWSENEIVTVLPGTAVARSNVTVEPDTWYLVAAVYNGSDMVVYVNGNDGGEAVTTTVDEGADGDIHIGTNEGASGGWFNGTIDEVLILNRALTAEEIKQKYDLDTVYSRTIAYYIASDANQSSDYFQEAIESLSEKAQNDMGSQNSDGSWNYDYSSVGGMFAHYRNINRMTKAYYTEGHSLYRNESLWNATVKGLEYPQTFGYPGIGAPGDDIVWHVFTANHLSVPLLLIQKDLMREDPDLFGDAKNMLKFIMESDEPPSDTGANLLWASMNHMRLSLIENNFTRLNMVRDKVEGQGGFTVGEGIQEDYSYHFHGAYLYTGEYGSAHFIVGSQYHYLTEGTSFQISNESLTVYQDYGLEGVLWALLGPYNDPAVVGRSIARKSTQGSIAGFLHFASMEGPWQERYVAASKQLLADWKWPHQPPAAVFIDQVSVSNVTPELPIGQRHYYRSDYSVYRHPDFYVSVKMLSDRIKAYESINGENLKGWHLSDGMTYITLNGSEYWTNNVWPTIDWLRLPGTTVERFTPATGAGTGVGTRSFVGGVSTGDFGLSAMDFKSNTGDLVANKSYFFFDEGVVALGTGISSNSGYVVETVINQWPLSNRTADFVVNGTEMNSTLGWSDTLEDTNWAHSDNIGYYFPNSSTIEALRENRSGKWSEIGTGSGTLYDNTFLTLTFNHSSSPDNVSYAYAVLPNKSRDEMETYSNSPGITIISQTNEAHAVADEGIGAMGIVFWKAGTVDRVKTNKPCLVFIQEDDFNFTLAVSEPTQQDTTLELTIDEALWLYNSSSELNNITSKGGETNLSINVSGGKTVLIHLTYLDYYTDNQPERGNGLENITSDDGVYASLVEASGPTGVMNVTFSSNPIPSDASIMQFNLTVQHYESDSDIELKAYYIPGNDTTWTEFSPAPTVSVGSEVDYIVDLKALGIDTPEEANGIKIKWEAIRDAGPNDITYVDQFKIDYEVAGRLDVNLVTPGDSANWVQNQSYWINATVTCEGYANAVCGDVNASVRYNVSSSAPDTSINMTSGATPFYIMENVKAVAWTDLSGWGSVTDPGNATDNDVGDEATKAYIECDFCNNASVKYVWDTAADGNSDASLYYLWETNIFMTNVYIEAWNFSSSSWGQLLSIEYEGVESKDIRRLDLDKDYINSTGGIEILFMANESTDTTTIDLYDVWVNIQPSGNSGINPYDLACFDIDRGDSCQVSWLVNATGSLNATYEIDTSFTSSYLEVANKDTDDATVIIVSP